MSLDVNSIVLALQMSSFHSAEYWQRFQSVVCVSTPGWFVVPLPVAVRTEWSQHKQVCPEVLPGNLPVSLFRIIDNNSTFFSLHSTRTVLYCAFSSHTSSHTYAWCPNCGTAFNFHYKPHFNETDIKKGGGVEKFCHFPAIRSLNTHHMRPFASLHVPAAMTDGFTDKSRPRNVKNTQFNTKPDI